jgi:hypothetical protein
MSFKVRNLAVFFDIAHYADQRSFDFLFSRNRVQPVDFLH